MNTTRQLGKTFIENLLYANRTLQHSRTKGSKNGIRLYQNKDGTWTELGKERRRHGGPASTHPGESNGSRSQKKVENQNTNKSSKMNWRKDPERLKEIEKDLIDGVYDKFNVTGRGNFNNTSTRLQLDASRKSDVGIEIYTRETNHVSDCKEAMKFLTKFDSSKERETIAKEYYDDGRVEKYLRYDNPYNVAPSRTDFKTNMRLLSMDVDPDTGSYQSYWHDGGIADHYFVVEGDMTHKKKPRISWEG